MPRVQKHDAFPQCFLVLFLKQKNMTAWDEGRKKQLLLKLLLIFVILVWCELQTSLSGTWTSWQAGNGWKQYGLTWRETINWIKSENKS